MDCYWDTRHSDSEEVKQRYKAEKLRHSRLVSSHKKGFYRNKIMNSNNVIRESWRVVRGLTDDGADRHEDMCLRDGDRSVNDPCEIAKLFNCFFVEEVDRMVVAVSGGVDLDEERQGTLNMNFALVPATEEEVIAVLQQVGRGRCAGLEEWTRYRVTYSSTVTTLLQNL